MSLVAATFPQRERKAQDFLYQEDFGKEGGLSCHFSRYSNQSSYGDRPSYLTKYDYLFRKRVEIELKALSFYRLYSRPLRTTDTKSDLYL
jgi:hypothetical protein